MDDMGNYGHNIIMRDCESYCNLSGRIWLDNVDCSDGDEVLEECSSNTWGVHNCDHSDDVGVICNSPSI